MAILRVKIHPTTSWVTMKWSHRTPAVLIFKVVVLCFERPRVLLRDIASSSYDFPKLFPRIKLAWEFCIWKEPNLFLPQRFEVRKLTICWTSLRGMSKKTSFLFSLLNATSSENKYRGYIRYDFFILTHRIIVYVAIWWFFTGKNGHIRLLKITRDGPTDGHDLF